MTGNVRLLSDLSIFSPADCALMLDNRGGSGNSDALPGRVQATHACIGSMLHSRKNCVYGAHEGVSHIVFQCSQKSFFMVSITSCVLSMVSAMVGTPQAGPLGHVVAGVNGCYNA